MASRKEERERLRQIRVEADERKRKAERKWLVAGYSGIGLVVLLVAAGIFLAVGGSGAGASGGAFINVEVGSTNGVAPDERQGTPPQAVKVADLKTAAKQAGCVVHLNLPDEGHNHISPEAKTPDYKTKPPTSGSHVVPPYQQADGAYSETPREIDFVHSLEHGRMEVQYSSKLPEADQLKLKGLYETFYAASLLFPNDNMPYQVAATTWTNMMGCKTYKGAITDDAIRDFGKATWGRYGGEPVGGFSFTGPTPANPSS